MSNDIKIEEPILQCPHCNEYILIEKLNCGIFRHGILKSNNSQINPHATKEECEYYINNNLIYGCGKPFKIIQIEDYFDIHCCEYI
jgi:hypothetical protein